MKKIMVSEASIQRAEAAGCTNFAALVQECAEALCLDTQRPDTYPHVDSQSFSFERDDWGRFFIGYTVRNGMSAEESGHAIEPTGQSGVWRLL